MNSDYEEVKILEDKIEKILSSKNTFLYKRKKLKRLKQKYQERRKTDPADTEISCIDYYLRLLSRRAMTFCASLVCALLIAGIFISYFSIFRQAEEAYQTPEASEETYLAAISAYEQGDYKTAIRNLTSCKETGWDGFAVYQYLSDSYYAAGDTEESVRILSDYLQNVWGTVNIQENNVLYQRYLARLPEVSEQTQEDLQTFTEEAAYYSQLYEKARNILKASSDFGLDVCALELKKAGADNTLFWEIYMSCIIDEKGSLEAWKEISPQMYLTNTLHSRQMTYEERLNILETMSVGTETGIGDSAEVQETKAFAANKDTYKDCGTGLTDIDPATGRDINGKIKDFDDEVNAVREEYSSYESIAASPFYEWETAALYWIHGSEAIRIADNHNDTIFAYDITHTLWYSYMDDLLYQEYQCPDLSEKNYLTTSLDVQMNVPAVTDLQELQNLIGTWKLENGQGVRNRRLTIHQIDTGNDRLRMKISILDTDSNTELVPATWLTFTDNKCSFEEDGWKFEIILGRQIYCFDQDGNAIPQTQGIDAIMLMNVDTTDTDQENCDGVYLKED